MNDLPRQKLHEIIQIYGHSLCDDPRRCEALLRDLCPEYRGEIFVLVNALKGGVAAALRTQSDSVPPEPLLARLTQGLQDNLALSEEAARWAVESWALVLGKLGSEETKEHRQPSHAGSGKATDSLTASASHSPSSVTQRASSSATVSLPQPQPGRRTAIWVVIALAFIIVASIIFFSPQRRQEEETRRRAEEEQRPLALRLQPEEQERRKAEETARLEAEQRQQEEAARQALRAALEADAKKGEEYLGQMVAYATVEGGLNNEVQIAEIKIRIEALNIKGRLRRGDGDSARALNGQGLASIRAAQTAAALQAFQQAYQTDPGDVEIINNLGYAYMQTGDTQSARNFFLLALISSPDRSAAWANLGEMYAKQGKMTEAVACFAHTYRFSGDQRKTSQFLEKLRGEHDDARVRTAAAQALQLQLIRPAINDPVVVSPPRPPQPPKPPPPSRSIAAKIQSQLRSAGIRSVTVRQLSGLSVRLEGEVDSRRKFDQAVAIAKRSGMTVEWAIDIVQSERR